MKRWDPEDHILIEPGPTHVSYSLDTGLITTVWYATSRKRTAVILPDGSTCVPITGVIEHFDGRAYRLRRRAAPAIHGQHIIIAFGGLRICATWPQSPIHDRAIWLCSSRIDREFLPPKAMRIGRHRIDLLGHVKRGVVRPLIAVPWNQFIPFRVLSHLNEHCTAGYWFRFEDVLYFTDQRDAVFARLYLSDAG